MLTYAHIYLKVHSANKWEEVDLGDTDRKNKFLRLMGAAKVQMFMLIVH